jgi:hypothetical protein
VGKFTEIYKPLEGKTYNLFGKSTNSSLYYQLIDKIADEILERHTNIKLTLQIVQTHSRKKKFLEKIAKENENKSPISFILHKLNKVLNEYTEKTDEHLRSLPVFKLWDRTLSTTRMQYHLYMLEVLLTNRIYSEEFRDTDKKIALLPYCLRDFKVECKSSPDDFDYQCRNCSKNCYQNHVSRLLFKNNIDAYIWMTADIKKTAKSIFKSNKTLGILGIACIPELVAGMRRCQKYNIPAIGIPLDANRCVRWMGNYNENSVNLEYLQKLITSQ